MRGQQDGEDTTISPVPEAPFPQEGEKPPQKEDKVLESQGDQRPENKKGRSHSARGSREEKCVSNR